MTNHGVSSIQFDDIRVEPRNFKVFKAGAALPLEPKTFLLLSYLIENRDRLVDKQQLLDAIWKDVAVTENSLTREIGKLRRALGDDPRTPRYIETVHTRGYRFIAAVRTFDDAPEEQARNALPVTSGVPFSPAAELGGPESRRRISKWLPYKFFVALSAVGLLIASGFLLRKPAEETKTPAAKRGNTTLAVLPFRPLSADMNDRYIGLGIADALITKLGNSMQLSIEPLSTVLHYADAKQDSLAIGRAMHVDYVLEGKFQKFGDRMRITVQLLCIACDANSRWAASFDETSKDLFKVQDSISQKVAAALPLELSGDEQKRLAKRETSNQQAQLAFAKGKLSLSEDTQASDEKAIEYEQSAISLDPGYGVAWAVLSDGYRRREWYGGYPADFLPLVREAAAKARNLDDDVSYTHSMLGLIAFQYDWDFGTAEREYQRARELQPSWIHQWYARYLLARNRPSEAEEEYERFTRAAPFSVAGRSNFAQFLFLTGQYPKALEQLHQTLLLRPDYSPAHELLGLIYEQQGLADKAEQEFQKASDLSHGLNGLAALGHLYVTSGRLRHAQQVLDKMRAQKHYVSPFDFAVIHAGLGYHRRALAELEQAYKERSLSAQSLRFDPRLNDLRRDPDYHEFAKRLGVD